MRPTKLKITGFGPYTETQTIEFDRFGSNGIYLIAGDTGTGKTTIFDAIMYALYGTASGENRDAAMLRSKYVEDGMPTEVELEFELYGKRYTVRRNPEYMRKKKSGEGYTKQIAEAELHYPDGKVETQSGRVTRCVEDLLGLSRAQFAQVAMIAQGDFLKLLLAETPERREIFRKIFNTSLYDAFQKKLNEEKNDAARKINVLSQSIGKTLSAIPGLCSDDEIRFYAEHAEAAEERIDKILENESARLHSTETRAENTEKEIAEVIQQTVRAEEKSKAAKALEEAGKEKEKTQKLLDEITKKEKERLEKDKDIQKAIRGIPIVESQLPEYDEKDKCTDIIEKCDKDIETQNAALTKYNAEYKNCTEELQKAEQENCRIPDENEKRAQLLTELAALNEREKAVNTLSGEHKKLGEQKEKCAEAIAARKRATETATECEAEARKKRTLFFDAQAGILAESLSEGSPCPVCGATHHPLTAKKPPHVPTQAEVEKSEKAAKEAKDEEGKKQAAAEAEYRVLKENTEKLKERFSSVFEAEYTPETAGETFSSESSRIKKEKADTEKNILEAEKLIKRKKELEKTITEKTGEKIELLTKCGEIKNALAALGAKKEETEKKKKSLGAKLRYDSKATAEERITSNRKAVDDYLKEGEENARQIKACEKTLAEINGREENLKKTAEGFREEELKELKEKKLGAESRKKEAQKEMEDIKEAMAVLRMLKESLKADTAQLKKEEGRWKLVSAVADTANGTITGKERISLETYVQMTYFEQIIDRTNVHFMRMTEGKFELKRKEVPDSLRGQSGLELCVVDHYNGSERSVKTLSGGESFIASLSLALGMAEEIQASSGGIQIDAMFIDEGFGTLDDETLQKAMKALQMLADENRIIGIISHREELMSAIDKQLVVTKSPAGNSTVSMVC